jgi:hypothetical protein
VGLIDAGKIKTKWFRDKWYSGNPREVLKRAKMEWVYLEWYKRFSSAIHSDAAAAKVLADLNVNTVASFAGDIYGAALYRMVECFGFAASSEVTELLTHSHEFLLGKRKFSIVERLQITAERAFRRSISRLWPSLSW